MARTKVSPDECLKQFQEGWTPSQVKEYWHISRQASEHWRLKFETEGKLEKKRLPRGRKPKRAKVVEYKTPEMEYPGFTELQEALLKTFQQAKVAEELTVEIEHLKAYNKILTEQLEASERKIKELIGNRQTYELMVNQGDLPLPLIKRAK